MQLDVIYFPFHTAVYSGEFGNNCFITGAHLEPLIYFLYNCTTKIWGKAPIPSFTIKNKSPIYDTYADIANFNSYTITQNHVGMNVWWRFNMYFKHS